MVGGLTGAAVISSAFVCDNVLTCGTVGGLTGGAVISNSLLVIIL